jgi:hypothetical protein
MASTGAPLYRFPKLQKHRASKGISKAELSRESKVNVGTISKMESRVCCQEVKCMLVFNTLNQAKWYDGALVSGDEILPCNS